MTDSQVEVWREGSVIATPPKVQPMPNTIAIVMDSLHGEITCAEDASTASALLKDIGNYEKRVKDAFDSHVKAANNLHKFLTGLRTMALAEVTRCKESVKAMLVGYQDRLQREAAELRRKLQEEADERARKQRKQEEAEALQRAMEKAAAEPEKAAEAFAKVEEVASAPIVTPTVQMPKVEKVAGVSMREVWKYRITNTAALLNAMQEGKAPPICMVPNDVFLSMQARNTKGDSPYPGVEFYCEKVAQSR